MKSRKLTWHGWFCVADTGVTVKVFLVDIQTYTIRPPVSVRAYLVQTVEEFKNLLSQVSPINSPCFQHVCKRRQTLLYLDWFCRFHLTCEKSFEVRICLFNRVLSSWGDPERCDVKIQVLINLVCGWVFTGARTASGFHAAGSGKVPQWFAPAHQPVQDPEGRGLLQEQQGKTAIGWNWLEPASPPFLDSHLSQ